jgi:FAD:protein FMN transferase
MFTFAKKTMKQLRFFKIAISLVLCSLMFQSCKEHVQHRISISGKALGTYYTVHFYHSDESVEYINTIQNSIDSLLRDLNSVASIYDSTSVISLINANKPYESIALFENIFLRSQQISELTGGAFDITVGPLVNAWGFGFTDSAHISHDYLDSLLQFTGFSKVRLNNGNIEKDDPRIMLDMNAIAKGYAVDLVAMFLESKGINSYIVEIGGEVRAGSVKPDGSQWIIAVEKPAQTALDPQQEDTRIYLEQIAVATSGTYRRYYERDGERFSHTIDPQTGRPVSHNLLSVTVVAEDCMTADALATAFMVLGKDRAMRLCETLDGVEAYFIVAVKGNSYETYHTKGFADYFLSGK